MKSYFITVIFTVQIIASIFTTAIAQVDWTKSNSNPVLSPGASGEWDSDGVVGAYVIYEDTLYHMWYQGVKGKEFNNLEWRFGYATSVDGLTWVKHDDNPILEVGAPGSWDDSRITSPYVLYSDSIYQMWYSGNDGSNSRIGYATSKDGVNWIKYDQNPVLTPSGGSWDSQYAGFARVIFDSADSTKMYYTGGAADFDGHIGYATAPAIINVPGKFETIQAAIDAASEGNVILVDEGTYFENIKFKGKAITVASHFYLDGDTSHISKTIIDGSKPSHPDSGSVVYFISGEDTTSELIGFTITNGSGTEVTSYGFRGGGGIFCQNSGGRYVSNIIINNTISDDKAIGGGIIAGEPGRDFWIILENNLIMNNTVNAVNGAYGGGVYLTSNGKVVDNTISYNSCTSTQSYAGGGGVNTYAATSLPGVVIIKGNQINHNFVKGKGIQTEDYWAALGGGIKIYISKVSIINNEISNNLLRDFGIGKGTGSGIYMYLAANGSIINGNKILNNKIEATGTEYGGGIGLGQYNGLSITNNIISKNSASHGGGISLTYNNAAIINNTIVNNTASSNGGGLYSLNSYPVVMNTILWDNQAGNGPQISGIFKVHYSDIQGGYTGTGNINVDPLFESGDSLYNLQTTTDTSICLNTGTDSLEVSGKWYYAPANDYAGNPRPLPIGTQPDMGAWEYDVVNVLEHIQSISFPQNHTLIQNYPNPFNPSTTIEFSTPKTEFVTLKIYNLLGQEVATVVSDKLTPGNYKYTWDAGSLASGLYLYNIQAGDFVETRKLILLR